MSSSWSSRTSTTWTPPCGSPSASSWRSGSRSTLLGGATTSAASAQPLAVERDEAEALLRDAETATYRAKKAGGGRVEIFDAAMRGDLVAELSLSRTCAAPWTEQAACTSSPS